MNRIKCSGIKKSHLIVCLTEIAAILLLIVMILLPNREYTVQIDTNNQSQVYALPFGRYIVHTEYKTDGFIAIVPEKAADNCWYSGSILTDVHAIDGVYTQFGQEFWVSGASTNVYLQFYFEDAGYSDISQVRLEMTDFALFCILFVLIAVFLITLIIFRISSGQAVFTKEKCLTVGAIMLITVLASLPVFSPYIPLGFDSIFHIVRIEGIKDGLLSGQFPVRIEPTYLNGYGYAVSSFYGGLFFSIPAIMRLIGFSLQSCYKFFLLSINAGMAVTSYCFFKAVFKKYYWGILGSLMFTMSAYKFCNMYFRGAVGEASAMAILPAIALAFWNIYTKPVDNRYHLRWIPLTISFSCLLETHIISTELVGITMLVICIINFKKTFRKETFKVLIFFVVSTIMINLYFIVPFTNHMLKGRYFVNSWGDVSTDLQETGLGLMQFFNFEIPGYDYQIWYEQIFAYCAGTSFFFGILCAVYAAFTGQLKKKEERQKYMFWFITSLVFMAVSSKYFPWDAILEFCLDKLSSAGLFIANMIIGMQFLYRLLILTVLFFTGLSLTGITLIKNKSKKAAVAASVFIALITVVQSVVLESSIISTEYHSKQKISCVSVYDGTLNRTIGMAEYMPITYESIWGGADVFDDRSVLAANAETDNYIKNGTNVSFTVTTPTKEQGWVEIPLLYYMGYEVYDALSGENISIFQGNTGRICFVMPGNTTYEVKVSYKGRKLWKTADFISLASIAAVCIYYGIARRKIRSAEEGIKTDGKDYNNEAI